MGALKFTVALGFAYLLLRHSAKPREGGRIQVLE